MCGGYNFICYNVNLCVIIIRVSRKKNMRTVQQYYDDNRDKILFDVRALEEYEKETIEASIHYYWEDMIKVLEDNKEEFEAKYSKDTPIYILCYTGQKSEEIEDILDEMGYEAYSLDGGFVAYLRWKFNKYLEQDKAAIILQKKMLKRLSGA